MTQESDRALLQEALEALQLIVNAFDALKPSSAARMEPLQINAARTAITNITARLEQPAAQPVAIPAGYKLVPMTPEQIDASWPKGSAWMTTFDAYKQGIRAAEAFHSTNAAPAVTPTAENEADELLKNLGLDPDTYRTDGGVINHLKVKAAIRNPDQYPTTGCIHEWVNAPASLGGQMCKHCGRPKPVAPAVTPTEVERDAARVDWCYSRDEERFHSADSREDAIAELGEDGGWIGQNNHPIDFLKPKWIGSDIRERVSEMLGDEVGEVAECFALKPDEEEELGRVVLDWINKGPGFKCYGVKNVERIEPASRAAIAKE